MCVRACVCEEGDRARKGGVISFPCFLYRSLAHFLAGAPSFRPPAAASGDHRERGMDEGREPWKHGGRGEVFSSNTGSFFSQLFSVSWFARLPGTLTVRGPAGAAGDCSGGGRSECGAERGERT